MSGGRLDDGMREEDVLCVPSVSTISGPLVLADTEIPEETAVTVDVVLELEISIETGSWSDSPTAKTNL